MPDLVHMHVSFQPSTDVLGRHSHMSLSTDSVSLYLLSGKAAELTLLTASCKRPYKRPKVLRFLAINLQCQRFSFPYYLYQWP